MPPKKIFNISKQSGAAKIDINISVNQQVEASENFRRALKFMSDWEVLVGVPDNKADRQRAGHVANQINNAILAAIHNNGSPKAGIPPRPFLEPGVQSVADRIIVEMERMGKLLLDGGSPQQALQCLHRIGLIAVQGVKKKLRDGPFTPLAPYTVAHRHEDRGTAMRPNEVKYLNLIEQGYTPAQAQADAGVSPLINTGQLLNAQTYVVRKR